MLNPDLLAAERQRFYVQTRGGVYFPVTGAIFWAALGIAGFFLSARTWCVLVLSMAALATPIAIFLFRKLVARLALKSPLATLILPALLPVALSLGMAIAAFQSDLSLVPLALVIGMASHWPAVGWMYGTSIYSVHAIARVVLAVAIWLLWPEARFTALPIAIGVLYALTSFWLLHEVRQVESRASRVEPRALGVRCTDDELIIQLADGRTLSVPLVWFPRLVSASAETRNDVRLIGGGEGLRWPTVDEDISVAGLLAGRASIEHSPARA